MVSVVCALARNRAIGRNNDLLWRIPDDLRRFKATTMGGILIMGRKTYESIGRPLPGRTTFVLTRNREWTADGVEVFHALDKAIEEAAARSDAIFVVGGGEVYREALPMADRLYLTLIDAAPEDADTFFPEFDTFQTERSRENAAWNGLHYTFLELER